MTRLDDIATIDGVDVDAEIVDGKLTIEDSAETGLHVETPEPAPLSTGEPHLTLFAADDSLRVSVTLNAEGLDALADAIYHTREGE